MEHCEQPEPWCVGTFVALHYFLSYCVSGPFQLLTDQKNHHLDMQ